MILIDTNLYSALENGVPSAVDVIRSESNIYIPIMVVGELKFGFIKGDRRESNNQRLNIFLSQNNTEVLYLTLNSAEIYGELSLYSRQRGRALSNNDIWIATLALENKARLVTYDKEFEVFSEILGDNLLIL